MIVIDERYNSRQSTVSDEQPSVELLYVVQGTDDDEQVKALVAATAPTIYAGLKRDSFSIEPLGAGIWECSVKYVKFEEEELGGEYTFDTTGGTQHITQSLQNMGRYAAPGETAPDFHGAIGVNQDQVEGTDITIPVFSFTETHKLPDSVVTQAYKATVFHLTGKVNNAPFKGFAAGEVLFMGASGSKRGAEDWEITYRFSASPNVTGLVLNDIVVASKQGWEYLWVRFADDTDDAAKVLIKKPIAAYVEKVYESADLGLLGIGT